MVYGNAIGVEGEQYKYYRDKKPGNENWWLRSLVNSHYYGIYSVVYANINGGRNQYICNGNGTWLQPCFSI